MPPGKNKLKKIDYTIDIQDLISPRKKCHSAAKMICHLSVLSTHCCNRRKAVLCCLLLLMDAVQLDAMGVNKCWQIYTSSSLL